MTVTKARMKRQSKRAKKWAEKKKPFDHAVVSSICKISTMSEAEQKYNARRKSKSDDKKTEKIHVKGELFGKLIFVSKPLRSFEHAAAVRNRWERKTIKRLLAHSTPSD